MGCHRPPCLPPFVLARPSARARRLAIPPCLTNERFPSISGNSSGERRRRARMNTTLASVYGHELRCQQVVIVRSFHRLHSVSSECSLSLEQRERRQFSEVILFFMISTSPPLDAPRARCCRSPSFLFAMSIFDSVLLMKKIGVQFFPPCRAKRACDTQPRENRAIHDHFVRHAVPPSSSSVTIDLDMLLH